MGIRLKIMPKIVGKLKPEYHPADLLRGLKFQKED
jgi:hypothetical protein